MVIFLNRYDAGRQLAGVLQDTLRPDEEAVVLGLPRGGLPVAEQVARTLRMPLDVCLVRKLGVPRRPELAMGAISEGGVRVLNDDVVRDSGVQATELAAIETRERTVLDRQARVYRESRQPAVLAGRTVVLVDDGIATGASARAACEVVRTRGAAKVVMAVPVAPPNWTDRLGGAADVFACAHTPWNFSGVGQFYADFSQTDDEEVVACLARANQTSPDRGHTGNDVQRMSTDAPSGRDVTIAAGPVRLAGELTVPGGTRAVVVFAHGSGSGRHSTRNRFVARTLNQAGIGTLLFDLLTPHEASDRSNVFDIGLLADRLTAALRWLRAQPETLGTEVGLFGASTGAAAALRVASEPDADVSAVVSRGGRPDLAQSRLALVAAPTLLIVGGHDPVVLDLNRQAQGELRCPSDLAVVPGATHLFEEPGTLSAAARLACDWFTDHLSRRPTAVPHDQGDTPRGRHNSSEGPYQDSRKSPARRKDNGTQASEEFSWPWARRRLDGLPEGRGLNIAHEAVDRHVAAGLGGKAALRCVAADLSVTTVTYEELARRSNRFANGLRSLGVGRGERVATLLGRCPELYVTVMGTLKNTSVYCPLFAAFGPEPVEERLRLGDIRVLVTTWELYTRKVADRQDRLPGLRHILIVGADSGSGSGTLSFDALLAQSEDRFVIPRTDPQEMALLHFTSGTTGTPKGAVHVHEAVVAHHATAASALDLRDDDVFWCTADPGWVTGTSYGVIAPLTHGVTMVVDAGEYSARRWYGILAEHRVNVWYTAPTAVRMLMRASPRGKPPELPGSFDLSPLRFIASVGEPLNPEAVRWSEEILGLPIHDNWWQTETGSIMIANVAGAAIRPGSMGRPLPGVEAGVLERGRNGRAEVTGGRVRLLDSPQAEGELALRPGWPSMFRGYLHADERYRASFADGWYLTGDVARRDTDGYYWFVGRADDVIKSAGHLVGPFEVESALMEHQAVAEAGVIGVPDAVAGEVVKAFVTLKTGFEADAGLARDILAFARHRLGPAMAPREVAFDQHLPKTRSGKVMRRLLRARELGLPEGDVSALEETR